MQCNRLTERMVQALKRAPTKLFATNREEWEKKLHKVEFSYRMRPSGKFQTSSVEILFVLPGRGPQQAIFLPGMGYEEFYLCGRPRRSIASHAGRTHRGNERAATGYFLKNSVVQTGSKRCTAQIKQQKASSNDNKIDRTFRSSTSS